MPALPPAAESHNQPCAVRTGALLTARLTALLRFDCEEREATLTPAEAARVSTWLTHTQTKMPPHTPATLTPARLRVWLGRVMEEADAWEVLAAFGTARTAPGIDRVLTCEPFAQSVRYLIAHHVSRDDLVPERNRALRKSLHAVEHARAAVNRAQGRYPTSRVYPSITRLNLAKDIAGLRAGHGWLPWDYSTSDAALDRVRPHFKPHARRRDRFAVADDLLAVKNLQDAQRDLSATVRRHRPTLGQLAPGEDGPWPSSTLRKHLLELHRALKDGRLTDTDLDALWSFDAALTTDHLWWHAVSTLTAARTRRAGCTVQKAAPTLAHLPLDGLAGLDRAAAKTVTRQVTRHASILDLLLTDPARLETWPSSSTQPAAGTIHLAFAQARTDATASHDLADQISAAVSASQQAFKALHHQIDGVLDSLLPDQAGSDSKWTAQADEIRQALSRREEAMDQFRIVLFGRTGAGKSSFVEALSRGQGSRISTGESDYTTTCSEVPWGACTLVDTPGIEGWGRQNASEQLEREARHALDTADLVILAFDTQNQKEGEFRKVASWVLEFDKPVLAILNVRNSQWRRPDKESDPDVRRTHSLSVAEHAQHTQDALTAFGLLDSLPVAVNGLNAVAGRCPDYQGPHAPNIHVLREKVGAEQLEQYSNFPVIERLLREILSSSALDLRLQSLANDIRHRLDDLAKTLDADADQALARAVGSEQRLEPILTIIGPGTSAERQDRSWRRASHLGTPDGSDLLTELEVRRQQAFAGSVLYGTIWDSWDDHCAVHLDAAHRAQTRLLEDALRDAFDRRRSLTTADLTRLYQKAASELAEAAQRAVEAVHEDLRRDIGAATEQMTARHVGTPTADSEQGLDGSAGTLARNVARALNAASIAVVFVPVPGVNLLAAAAIRIVGQVLLNLFSKRTRQASERDRAAELRQALIAARDAVTQMRQEVEHHSTLAIRNAATTIAVNLRHDAEAALTARKLAQQHTATAATLRTVRDTLPQEGAGSAALASAKERLAQNGDDTTGQGWRPLALGEDWLTDTNPTGPARSRRRNHTTPAALATPFEQAHRTPHAPAPSPQATRQWLKHLAASEHEPIRLIARDTPDPRATRPTVVLTGPRRVGVSALHSALPTPDAPTFDPIDASSQPDAPRLVAGAALVGLVMPPSLFGSTDGPLRHLGPDCLHEDTTKRLVLLLNRIDELAIDPDAMPDQLAAATERKIAEVRRYATRMGLPADLPVLPISAAPYGSGPDEGTQWFAGTERLHQALSELLIPQDGAAASVRTAVAQLDTLCRRSTAELETILLPSQAALQDRAVAITTAQVRGRHLQASLSHQLTRSLEAIALPLAYDVSGAANKTALHTARQAMYSWRELGSVSAAFSSFEDVAHPRVQEWLTGSSRTIAATEFTLATTAEAATVPKGQSPAIDILSPALAQLTKLARRLSEHSEFYNAGKEIGFKFRPWQAVRGAQRMIKVTRGLAVLGAAVAVYEAWDTERAEKARNALRVEAPQTAREDVADLVRVYLDGTTEHPGLGAQIQQALKQLEADAEVTQAEVTALAERIHHAESLRTTALAARARGLALLDLTEEKTP